MKKSPSKVKNCWNFTIGTLQEVQSVKKKKKNTGPKSRACNPCWKYTGLHGYPSIHSPTHACPSALWRACQLRPTISSAFMNMYCLLATTIQKKKEKKALFQTTLTLTRAQDFFQTPNVLGSQMVAWSQGWKKKKIFDGFDFQVHFMPYSQ